MKRFVYFYLMKNDPDAIRAAAPHHARYWRDKALPHFQGGPFVDHSGGCITFAVASVEMARELITRDPFRTNDCLSRYFLMEWLLDE
ncbi:MAG: hypothetical protein ACFB51_08115 [Anaerolineae bacterium]